MEVQISLKSVLKWIMQGIVWILIAAVLFGAAAFVYSKHFVKPVYQSTIKFFVDSTATDSQMINYYIAVAPQYIQLLNVNEFYEMVADELLREEGVVTTSAAIASKVSFSQPTEGTGVFWATVKSNDPHDAYLVASAVAQLAPERIMQLKPGDRLGVAEQPHESHQKVSPNVTRNTLLGVIIGFVLAAVVVVMKEFFDTRLKSPDEITQYYGLPILGTIPDFTALEKSGKKGGD